MNRRFLMALAAAVCFGLLAILIVQQIIAKKAFTDGSKSVQIVFAKTKIPFGTTINEAQLKSGTYASADIPAGAIYDAKQVIGKIATTEIEANLPITSKNIATDQHWGVGSTISEDKRAMTIRVDEASGVAGFARPGSFVDVIAVMTVGGTSKQVATTVAQNLRVLALGQETQIKTDTPSKMGNSVTLEVTMAQAETLTLAMREGTLHLVLRNPSNQVPERVLPVVKDFLVEDTTPKSATSQTVAKNPLPPSMISPKAVISPSPLPPVTNTPSKLAQVTVYEGQKGTTVPVRQ